MSTVAARPITWRPAAAPGHTAARQRARLAWLVLLAVAMAPFAYAQPASPLTGAGTIQGRVVDAETGAPLAGVLVIAEHADRRTTTDAEGRFTLDGVPTGPRTLVVSLVGYALARRDVEVATSGAVDLTVPLAPGAGAYTEALVVRAGDQPARTTAPVEFRMRSAELQELRGVLADDPFRAIQAMPGVATGDDFRAEFSVRGSDFRQMGLAVDGVPAPWLVHGPRAVNDTGTVTMVNADVLAEIGLTSGAAPQPYGNRTGAWVQSALREGSRDAVRLSGALSGTGASAVLEGPLGRARRGAWLASVRKSYIDWLIAQLDIAEDSQFGFADAQSKIAFDVSPRHQLQLAAVAGRSRYRETDETPSANGIAVADASTALVIGTWRSTLGQALVLTQRATWAGLRYENRGDFAQTLARGTEQTTGYRADVTVAPSGQLSADVGVAVDHDRAQFTFWRYSGTGLTVPALRSTARWSPGRWRVGAYGRARVSPHSTLAVDVGTRVDRESAGGHGSASPWLLARWSPASRWSFSAGAGLTWQLADLSLLPPPGASPTPGLERARSADVSVDYALSPTVGLRASLYDRAEAGTLRQDAPLPRLVNGVVRTPAATNLWLNAIDVEAHGVEFTLRRTAARGLVGWVSYGYGTTRATDRRTGDRYWADFDQRHQMNTYASYRLGARTNIGAKFRYGSNMPIPAYLGGTVTALTPSARRNEVRLPSYARLDLRASRTFHWSTRRLTLFAEVLNALGRDNLGRTGGSIRSNGLVSGFTEPLFPRLPSAGLRVEF